METKELLKKVKKIELKSRKLSNHIFSGQYHTSFKGTGMTFSEVRQYQYGDDVRSIDWNVSARYQDTYIKVFEEERELTLMLLVDCSASSLFGTKEINKKELIAEICATLAFSASQNNDKIGIIFFTDQVELFIPPKKGKSHILRIIRELIEFQPKNKATDINVALEFLSGVMKKKAIAFVLSDFISKNFDKSLQIASRKHDVTGIRVFDEKETNLSNLGFIPTIDFETGNLVWVDTSSTAEKNTVFEHYNNSVTQCKKAFSSSGSGLIETATDESYVTKLISYFKSRS
jgi:uncharacterized protein (DUF58 family)